MIRKTDIRNDDKKSTIIEFNLTGMQICKTRYIALTD